MSTNFADLLDEMEEKEDGFGFKDFGDAKYAEVGDYLAKLTKIEERESANGKRGVHFVFEVVAPEENVGEIIEQRFYPESGDVNSRIMFEFAAKLHKLGEYKLPRTKLKDLDTLIGYLTELKDVAGITLKFSVRAQKGNAKYTNVYCNGEPKEDYVPKGKDLTFVKPVEESNDLPVGGDTIDTDELPF